MNLRGLKVRFRSPATGALHRGEVVTRIRGTRWMIEAPLLSLKYRRPDGSRRIVLDRSEFQIEEPPASDAVDPHAPDPGKPSTRA